MPVAPWDYFFAGDKAVFSCRPERKMILKKKDEIFFLGMDSFLLSYVIHIK